MQDSMAEGGQTVTENTKHSRNIQKTHKIIKLDTKTHISFKGKNRDYRVEGGISAQLCEGSQKLEGGKQKDEEDIIDKRTKRWHN